MAKFRSLRNWYLIRRYGTSFFGSQWSGGVILVVFAALALLLANMSSTKEIYHHILGTDIGLNIGDWSFSFSVEKWINEAMMAIFFFVVGLEIKREIVAGHLSSFKQASLPVAAALGGMIVPALIYFSLNGGTEYEAGWGIPMATDIAFAIGVLSLFGRKMPLALKVFLTALAIVDDLGAILVIAVFYTSHINFAMLGGAIAILALLFLMNRMKVTMSILYIIPGIAVWYLLLHSGVHATIAGVLVAMSMPTKPRFTKKYFMYKVRYFLEEFRFYDKRDEEVLSNENQMTALTKMDIVAHSAVSPAQRLEHKLNPFVTFLIMPVFALANAGVDISALSGIEILESTQSLGIILGLVVGKPVGIFLFCWLTIRLRMASMPEDSGWGTLLGVACLGGIGFTMSIFIDNLAFGGTNFVDTGKIAVLAASVLAAIVGAIVINIAAKSGSLSAKKRVMVQKNV
jgi:NhaA family Na+:H+ antiporter